jgi:chloramphenicol 3-O phosphotransferase
MPQTGTAKPIRCRQGMCADISAEVTHAKQPLVSSSRPFCDTRHRTLIRRQLGRPCMRRPPTGSSMPITETLHPPYGTIVVLNGPSSSGKSTLSRYLCENLVEHHLHIELDAFRNMEPTNYWDVGQQLAQVRVAALCRAINATAATFSRHGQPVIVDHVLSSDAWHYMLEDLIGLPVLVIGVFCSLEILIERELTRGDRKIGLAKSQFDSIHTKRHYDHVVDTSSSSALDCAQSILEWLRGRPHATAFSKMHQQSFGGAK